MDDENMGLWEVCNHAKYNPGKSVNWHGGDELVFARAEKLGLISFTTRRREKLYFITPLGERFLIGE